MNSSFRRFCSMVFCCQCAKTSPLKVIHNQIRLTINLFYHHFNSLLMKPQNSSRKKKQQEMLLKKMKFLFLELFLCNFNKELFL